MIGRLIHTLRCVIRRDCPVFQGDDFTDWLARQKRDSAETTATLRRAHFVEADLLDRLNQQENRHVGHD